MIKLNIGEKSEEYPHGYGYCQCGCGRKTVNLSNGMPLKYCGGHKFRDGLRKEIGTIVTGYEKGWGLCQCGCGKKTKIGWKRINGKIKIEADKYCVFHYAKTEESRRRQSIVGTKVIKERDYSPFVNYGRSEHALYFSKKLGYEIGYMSNYEKLAFEILDNDSAVESYLPQPISIEYNYNGSKMTYTPDILIYYKDGEKTIVEVKPKALLEKSKNKAKFQALKDFCKKRDFDFEIWDEDILASKAKSLLPERE